MIDTNLDGKFDVIISYKNGKIFSKKKDSNFDNFFELRYFYSKKGKIVKKEYFNKKCKIPVKIEENNILFIDLNCSGIFEKKVVTNGNKKTIFIDKNEDKVFEQKWIYYGKKLVSAAEDKNNDGKFDYLIFYKDSKLSKIEIDSNFNGKIDIWEFYKNNKLVKRSKDLNFDGKIDIEE